MEFGMQHPQPVIPGPRLPWRKPAMEEQAQLSQAGTIGLRVIGHGRGGAAFLTWYPRVCPGMGRPAVEEGVQLPCPGTAWPWRGQLWKKGTASLDWRHKDWWVQGC